MSEDMDEMKAQLAKWNPGTSGEAVGRTAVLTCLAVACHPRRATHHAVRRVPALAVDVVGEEAVGRRLSEQVRAGGLRGPRRGPGRRRPQVQALQQHPLLRGANLTGTWSVVPSEIDVRLTVSPTHNWEVLH